MGKGTKKEFTVEWILVDKQLVKFKEDKENTYNLAENTVKYLDSIKEGDSVNVTIDENKIIFIGKQKAEAKSETKEETKTEPSNDTGYVTWTVKAVTSKKDVVKFEEGDVSWYLIPSNVRDSFTDAKKGTKLSVQIGTAKEEGKKNPKEKPAVVAVQQGSVEPPKESSGGDKGSEKSYSTSNSTNDSIEKQVVLKEAGAIVRAYIEAEHESVNSVDKVKPLLLKLTKICYEALKSI